MTQEIIGIIVCLMHSAIFSGLNLGFFGMSRLKLAVQADTGDKDAKRILKLRTDAHLLLATLLWGNVASNVLLALLANSVMTGVSAFIFSTFGITFFGEIIPQAYLSRHMLKMSYLLVPVVRFYRAVFYPLSKPTALLLDKWLGRETISYFQEDEIAFLLHRHANSKLTDLEQMETLGAVNFLEIDDIKIGEEGEIINPKSIVTLPINENKLPLFPLFEQDPEDPFLKQINESNEKWVIIVDGNDEPKLVLNADQFLRDALYTEELKSIYTYCHRPIVVRNPKVNLGEVILKFKVRAEHAEDDVVDNDIVLFWGEERRIITGADILGRLLRGIVTRIEQNN